MADLLASGAAWLAGKLKTCAGKAVTYRRGAQALTVTATIGLTELEVQVDDMRVERFRSRDFIFTRADIETLVGGWEPARGDYIDEEIAGVTRRHEVMSPPGRGSYSDVDPHAEMVRVHTKFVEVIA